MAVQIIFFFSIITEILCNPNEIEETFEKTLIKNSAIIYSIIYLIIFIASCIISLIIIFKERNPSKDILETSAVVKISDQNNSSNNQENANDKDEISILLGLSYLGRFILTIESLEVIFFLYNLFIQAILLIPGLLYDMTYIGWRNFFVILYFIFSIFSSSVLIIPSYEFFCFPFLRFSNPFCHLISFRYIINDEDYDKKINKNSNKINLFFSILGLIFLLLYIIGFFTQIFLIIKDISEILISMFIFTYYISIVLCYFLLSLKFVKDIICFKPFKKMPEHRIFLILNSYFDKRTFSLPDINLITYLVNPYLYKNYKMNEFSIIPNQDNAQSSSNIEKQSINFIDENHYNEIRQKFTCKDNINKFFLYLKIFLIFFSPSAFWYIFQTDTEKDLTIILFVIVYLIILVLSFSINFPLDILNQRVSVNTKSTSNSLSFLLSISISYFLSLLIFSLFTYITFIKNDLNEENFNRFNNLN